MRSRQVTATVLAALLALSLAACGSDGGGGEAADATTTTEAPTTTTEDPIADISGDWIMSLQVVEVEPADAVLTAEDEFKERSLVLALGECPAPADVVFTPDDPVTGTIAGSAGETSGECVGSASVGTSTGSFDNLPLVATADGFATAVRIDQPCISQDTGAAVPDSSFVADLEYEFSVADEDVDGTVTSLEGTVIETNAPDNTCESRTGADITTHEMTAAPA